MADLHLSLAVDKPMDIFGSRWDMYQQKIFERWNEAVAENDTVIIPGDVSWAMSTEEATKDFEFIEKLNGKKIILRGNHDFWWSTKNKLTNWQKEHAFDSICFLQNDAAAVEDFIVCGSRGWYPDMQNAKCSRGADNKKIVAREAIRLKMSLDAAKTLSEADSQNPREIMAFMHFPPYFKDYCCDELIYELYRGGVKRCFFGHIHGSYNLPAVYEYSDIKFELISSDFLDFRPKKIEVL